ncbi:MAG: hypothetical protein K0R25_961 [Rickettsiaceae bacterium]|jgi:hypothetical protein|nr:hypothetical protein [Rickettsiaceae bacterium]
MKFSPPAKTGLLMGILGAAVVCALCVWGILSSTSSTAVIGFIFIPFVFAISFIGFFVSGYLITYVKIYLSNAPRVFNFKKEKLPD